MKKIIITMALMSCILSSFAAQIEHGKTLVWIAVEGVDRGYFSVSEPLAVPCKYGVIYYSGKSYLAILMGAKAMDLKLSTIAYDIDASNVCTVSTIETK